ncbi:MAG: PAS domain S-box protein [Dehalococcoidia bacterium]
MAALGETDDIATLDQLAASVEDVQQKTDLAIYLFQGSDAKPETIVQMASQYEPLLWPSFDLIQNQVDQLARAQQAKAADVRAAADRSSEVTMWLLIGLGVATFLVGFAVLIAFTVALVRPLASLKANARAIISGNREARAEVWGLEETASLARDLNEMTETLVTGSAQLEESEARFRDVLDVSRDLIYKLNLETRTYDYVSPSSTELLGFEPAEITAMGLDEVRNRFHPEDRQRFGSFGRDAKGDAVADRKALGIEYRWKCKDGAYRWLSDDRAFVRDSDGKLLAVVGTVRDITERKQADAALRESEERFRTLSASAPIGIFLSDARGNGVYSNENAVVLIGGTTEDGLGRIWTKYVHPDDREALMAEGANARANRRKFSMEYRILTKTGEVRWVHTTIVAIRSAEGVVTGYVGTIEDVTDRKRAEEEMADRLRIESAIAQASNLLAASDDTDTALNLVLRVLGEAFGAERAHIFMLDGKTKMHCVARWCAPEAEEVSHVYDFDSVAFPWSTQKALQAEPIIVNDIDTLPPEAAAEKSAWQSLGIHSIVLVSLTSGGRVIGAIGMDTMHSTCVWREEDVKLLRLAAESISAFIDRQHAAAEKRDAYEKIVFLLATAAEARDPYTENHLSRIKHYSEAIALEIGLSPEEAGEIGLSALLHDLGKIRVPDSILTKPGPLSEDEWHIMRKHPIWGEELLPPDPWFKKARQITRWHHENWDGTGYPDGLHADMIPLCTAIVSVADGFDAMTSRRPYKAPWPPVRAMREISKNRGKKYSPAVVDAFMRAVASGEIDRIVKGRPKQSSDDLARAA